MLASGCFDKLFCSVERRSVNAFLTLRNASSGLQSAISTDTWALWNERPKYAPGTEIDPKTAKKIRKALGLD
jgi:hypothetical protein